MSPGGGDGGPAAATPAALVKRHQTKEEFVRRTARIHLRHAAQHARACRERNSGTRMAGVAQYRLDYGPGIDTQEQRLSEQVLISMISHRQHPHVAMTRKYEVNTLAFQDSAERDGASPLDASSPAICHLMHRTRKPAVEPSQVVCATAFCQCPMVREA